MRNETSDREKERSISYRPLRAEHAGVTPRMKEFRICSKTECSDWRNSPDPELAHDVRGQSGNPRRGRDYPARGPQDVTRAKPFASACGDAGLLFEKIATVDVDEKRDTPPQVSEKNRVADRTYVATVQNIDVPRCTGRQPSPPPKLIGEDLGLRKRKGLSIDRVRLG